MRGVASLSRRERKAARQEQIEVHNDPVSMVAAAVNVKVTNGFQNLKLGGTDWQAEGWVHYDNCPEFHAGVNIVAYNLSRARLIGVEVDPVTGTVGTEATEDVDVVDAMAQFFGGPVGQSQALDRLARHLTVAGEAWALATPAPDVDGESWEILASSEITGSQGRIMVQELNGTPRPVDTDTELLMRIWRPHPKRRQESDSVTRSLLPVLRELASLNAMVSATVKSRLASSGILWLPDDITLPAPANAPNDDTQTRSVSMGADGWLDLITEAMTAPIQDPDSASAVVPLVAMVKGDKIEQIKHMEFGRDLDSTVEPLRAAGVQRLAVGMDMPPEVLTGTGSTNHWTAWAISEDFAKAFLAPLLELIVDAATRFYLRPWLRSIGRDPARFAVWFDLAALFPRQISVDNAQAAYDAGLLSEKAYLAALGFSEAEAASPPERARNLLEDMVKRGIWQTVDELMPMLRILFPGLPDVPLTPVGATGSVPQALPAAPGTTTPGSTEPVPTTGTPAAPARPGPAPGPGPVTTGG